MWLCSDRIFFVHSFFSERIFYISNPQSLRLTPSIFSSVSACIFGTRSEIFTSFGNFPDFCFRPFCWCSRHFLIFWSLWIISFCFSVSDYQIELTAPLSSQCLIMMRFLLWSKIILLFIFLSDFGVCLVFLIFLFLSIYYVFTRIVPNVRFSFVQLRMDTSDRLMYRSNDTLNRTDTLCFDYLPINSSCFLNRSKASFVHLWLSFYLSVMNPSWRTCEFAFLHSTWINVLYQKIQFSLQLPFAYDEFESVLIKVFSTGNIYPATCSWSKTMWDCVHWNRPPVLSFYCL